MEIKEADDLRKAWGDKPCAHPWWVEETLGGADTGKVACKTCGRDRRKGEPAPAPAKDKTTTGAATLTPPAQPVKELDWQTPILDQHIKELDLKTPILDQQVDAPDLQATPLNPKVKDLESAVEGVVAMLGSDFAFTMPDAAKIASVAGKLRDALGGWRERKKRSP